MSSEHNPTQQRSAQAQAFWRAWAAREDVWPQLQPEALLEQANHLVAQYMPGVVVELLTEENKKPRLVLSANGHLGRFPDVQALLAHAPASGWVVEGFRRRSNGGFRMGMDGFELDSAQVLAGLQADDARIALDVAFAQPVPPAYREHARNMAHIMLDHLLGEWDFAVKVGAVHFVDQPPANAVPLNELAPVVDAFWKGELAHTALYPQGEHRFSVYQTEEDEDEGRDALFITRNESANSLLGRADMGWCIRIVCTLQVQQDAEKARDLEDAFFSRLQAGQQGMGALVIFNLTQGVRTLYGYTGDAAWGRAQAERACEEFADLHTAIETEFDPAWRNYRL